MKERRNSISSNSSNETSKITASAEINSNDQQNGATKKADTAITIPTTPNNKSDRWPAVPEGVFDVPAPIGTMITREKLDILSYDKRNDDENYDDSLYMDHYESLENEKITARYDGDEDVWERLKQLEHSEKVIDKNVKDIMDIENRLYSVFDFLFKLENKFEELELKYNILEKKYLQEISKKKNKNDP
jgi:hypothetical protein